MNNTHNPQNGLSPASRKLNAELRQLARLGSLSRTAKALLAGADPLDADAEGCTALMAAVESNSDKHRLAIVKLLLPQSNPDATNARGDTAFTLAIRQKRLDCAKALLPQGIGIDHHPGRIGDWTTPLIIAVQTKNVEMVAFLLKHANPDIQVKSGNTALTTAFWSNFAEGAKLLFEKADLSKHDTPSSPLVFIAIGTAHDGDQELLDMALAHGCNPHLSNIEGTSPFTRAAAWGSLNVLKAIYAKSKPSGQAWSKALMAAVLQTKNRSKLDDGMKQNIEFLCEHMDLDSRHCNRRTPFNFAQTQGCAAAAALIKSLEARAAERLAIEEASAPSPSETSASRMRMRM